MQRSAAVWLKYTANNWDSTCSGVRVSVFEGVVGDRFGSAISLETHGIPLTSGLKLACIEELTEEAMYGEGGGGYNRCLMICLKWCLNT